MTRIFLSIVLIFTLYLAQAQCFDRAINWVASTEGTFKSLAFGGSVFSETFKVPVYEENIWLSSSNVSVRVENIRYESVSPGSVSDYQQIPDSVVWHGVVGFSGGKPILQFMLLPFVRTENELKRIISFSIHISEYAGLKSAKVSSAWKNSSVLNAGKWIKIKTANRGIFKITYDKLREWGFSNPESVALFGNGGYVLPVMNNEPVTDDLSPYAFVRGKDKNGKDCMFFYSTGTISWAYNSIAGLFLPGQNPYAIETYFYLTDSQTPAIAQQAQEITENASRQSATFDDYQLHELESVNLLESGSRWFGERFLPGASQTITFSLTNADLSSPVRIRVNAAARSSATSAMSIALNGSAAGTMAFSGVTMSDITAAYASDRVTDLSKTLTSADLSVKLTYSANNSQSEAWLDYICLNYKSNLSLSSGVVFFRDVAASATGIISNLTLSNASSTTKILDVTDFTNSRIIPYSLSGTQAVFKVKGDGSLKEYVAFRTDGDFSEPEKVAEIATQNLHGLSAPDFLIVSNSTFLLAANEIAAIHRSNDGMDVEVVTPDKIYNEFSGGAPDAAGIRNFIRMLYEKGKSGESSKLKYVLLVGDGSYDNRNILRGGANCLPTYQSDNSILPTESFVSDDFFVLLDESEGGSTGIIDLGIGRIPSRTLAEAQVVVDKIANYTGAGALGNWRNAVCFIADDEDGNLHMSQAETLATYVNANHPELYTDKIYFDAYKQVATTGGEKYPEVTDAINKRVKEGALLLNYTGHANEKYLAEENVLGIPEIQAWTNSKKLPVFVTATCEFSRFDGDETSAGEYILFNEKGGGVGLFSTSRVVYSGANFNLNSKFFNYVFERDQDGNVFRLGDVMRLAKAASNTGTNKRNFTLLADPALRLSIPRYKVLTETINGKSAAELNDTIRSLSKVTVSGYIADYAGNKLDDFNGEIIPMVYDKAVNMETLGNGGEKPMEYTMQSNVIFKGLATVKNGVFEYSFFVPKDISFKTGQGKILYYADNGQIDANGVYNGFNIGGTSGNVLSDSDGPEVKLYLNSTNFKDNDKVSSNSVLLAYVSDATGINTVGTGIGHDITAVLDDDYSNTIVLNDYFQYNKDSYTSGTIVYPLTGLAEGVHRLRVKVWDVLNNSTEVEISFVVKDDFRVTLHDCYPNPVTDHVFFRFSHNQPDESFDVRVQVYNSNGSVIDQFDTWVTSDGISAGAIEWHPLQRVANLRSGLYVYRLLIQSGDGKKSSVAGKFIFSK
jgi:hypothetical protein